MISLRTKKKKHSSVFTWSFLYWFMFAAFLFTIRAKTPFNNIKCGEKYNNNKNIQKNGHLCLQSQKCISKQENIVRANAHPMFLFAVQKLLFNLECRDWLFKLYANPLFIHHKLNRTWNHQPQFTFFFIIIESHFGRFLLLPSQRWHNCSAATV